MFKFIRNRIAALEKEKKELLEKLEEVNKKLYEYMDITRKEALESYRKGLQDGVSIQTRQEPLSVSREPVKSVEEHKNDIVQAKEISKEEAKAAKFMANLFSYDGNTQKEVED